MFLEEDIDGYRGSEHIPFPYLAILQRRLINHIDKHRVPSVTPILAQREIQPVTPPRVQENARPNVAMKK
jgi:hypothetical protein